MSRNGARSVGVRGEPPRLLELLTRPAPAALVAGALLLLRLTLALVFFAHGWDALQNLGIAGTVAAQRESGIPVPEIAGPFTVYLELIGSPLLALGALTRPVATGLAGLMLGAFAFIHAPNGIFVENGGFELVLVLATACALLAVLGPGRYSLDGLFAARRPQDASRPPLQDGTSGTRAHSACEDHE